MAAIRKQISGLPSTALRSKAAAHLATAIKEVELALVHAKFKAGPKGKKTT